MAAPVCLLLAAALAAVVVAAGRGSWIVCGAAVAAYSVLKGMLPCFGDWQRAAAELSSTKRLSNACGSVETSCTTATLLTA